MVGDAPTKSIFLLWERLISSDFATRLSSIMKSAQASTALYASCVVLAAATPLRRYFDSSNELSSSSTRPVGPTLTASTRPCPSIFADADVVSELLMGRKGVIMDIKADVDVEVETALGEFKIRRIPASGRVPVKRR